jgi:hypothetical protein
MSQRWSGRARLAQDAYYTPGWVVDALLDAVDLPGPIWECAAGSGQMVEALKARGFETFASDIEHGVDFLQSESLPPGCRAIVTNPPFNLAQQFIEHGLTLTKPVGGTVAVLLKTDFDAAKTRQHLFGHCDIFEMKLVLTRRIRWFADSKGSPSTNHAWFCWSWAHRGQPTITYAPITRTSNEKEARAQS